MLKQHNNMKKSRFLDILVVVFICLFLLTVVPVACRKARIDTSRATCARNLSVIGKAMMRYANDNNGELPRTGGEGSYYTDTANWRGADRFEAFYLNSDGSGGMTSISSCFYLLVKYANVAPKFFVCPGDSGTTEFKLGGVDAGDRKLVDLWDFGPLASDHCSYAYHMPFGSYPLNTSCEPGMAIAADKNPWVSSRVAFPGKFSPDGDREAIKAGNSVSHQEEGQNVLFLDNHVSFEECSFCGINDDNIYTFWEGLDIRIGFFLLPEGPKDRKDSLLIHDDLQAPPITIEQLRKLKSPSGKTFGEIREEERAKYLENMKRSGNDEGVTP